jgi:hypothetical protein
MINIKVDDKKIDYKKLYNYIKLFVKLNDIKSYKNDIYVKDLLIEIENVFRKYGFVKNLHEMHNLKT